MDRVISRGDILEVYENDAVKQVPVAEGNRDYHAVLEWQAQGGIVEDGEEIVSLEDRRTQAYLRLSQQYESFVNVTCGYTPGWLSKAKELQAQAEIILADPTSTTAQTEAATQLVALMATLRAWDNTISDYYMNKSNEIMGSDDPASVVWDFSQFQATDPVITLPWHLLPLAKTMRGEG